MLFAMHLPDHAVSSEATIAVAGLAAAAAAIAARPRLRSIAGLVSRTAAMFAAVTALVFAGQMVNYAVPGTGVSGHLLGAALATLLLGPAFGAISIALVLTVQCVFFADGGLTALSTNIFNMAVVGSAAAYGVRRVVANDTLCAVAAGTISVLASAVACAAELAVSGVPTETCARLIGHHAAIGVVEGLLTAAFIVAVVRLRRLVEVRSIAAMGFAAALVVAVALAPLASTKPDALEAALEQAAEHSTNAG